MRVKMLEDAPGSPDGVNVLEYAGGKVYEVNDDLGNVFVNEGLAKVDESTTEPEPEPAIEPDGADTEDLTKQDAGPSENK